jgi:predicted ArsR family transcriptional regulator
LLDFFGGNYPAAILCNQLLYWQDKQVREDGGIYKTYKDWRAEIGLSDYQVRCAANRLKERGFLETHLHKANGAPTVHYYLKVDTFSESILEFLQNPILSFSRIHGKETKESLTENTS